MSFEHYLIGCLIFVGVLAYILFQGGPGDPNIKPFVAKNGERFSSNWHCMQVNFIILSCDGIRHLYEPRVEEYKRENGLL